MFKIYKNGNIEALTLKSTLADDILDMMANAANGGDTFRVDSPDGVPLYGYNEEGEYITFA